MCRLVICGVIFLSFVSPGNAQDDIVFLLSGDASSANGCPTGATKFYFQATFEYDTSMGKYWAMGKETTIVDGNVLGRTNDVDTAMFDGVLAPRGTHNIVESLGSVEMTAQWQWPIPPGMTAADVSSGSLEDAGAPCTSTIEWDSIQLLSAGDATEDGVFNSADLIEVFRAGEFADGFVDNSLWATGDWDFDGEFETSDMLDAFKFGGYATAAVPPTQAVPEPHGVACVVIALALLGRRAAHGHRIGG